ncbi:MAG: DUF4832 domain-containing protein [Ruminococcus sp.]|nr:DUF4832 domain-containing protein [Ruminococcus sp.]
MKKIIAVVSTGAMLIHMLTSMPFISADAVLKDSGINYTESTSYTPEPCDCGYTSSLWIKAEPNKNWSTNVTHYSLLLIGIGAYSSGMNASNTDYDFDDIFFESLENTLQSARTNNVTVGLRFRYDDNGTTNPEPKDFAQVLKHIQQIGDSKLLEKYSDVISFVETGFVGSWGEQWGGKYTDLSSKAQVLDKFLSIVPDPIPVLIRTPNTFRQWLSDYCHIDTTPENMSYQIADKNLAKKASRVGLYNDGYMGSDSDLGTYSNREGETAWLATTSSYGGEFSGSDEWRLKYTTWQPEYALKEMYYTNLLRINGNIYKTHKATASYDTQAEAQARLDEIKKLYADCGLSSYDYAGTITQENGKYIASWNWIGYDDFTFDKNLNQKLGVSCDNSAFYGQTVWQFIRSHLGYRFVLRESKITDSANAGDMLEMNFTVENTGFSNAPCDKETEILLSDGETVFTYTTDINASDWKSDSSNPVKISIPLPKTIHGGNWNVYLRISNLNTDAKSDTKFCTVFANEDIIYDENLCANYMGNVKISGQEESKTETLQDERPTGFYLDSEKQVITESESVNLLNAGYDFQEDGHYGFTFIYKMDGVTAPVSLGKWYAGFTVNGNSYGSAYTTYGLNIRNQEITENGIYAMYVPFYGCAFNCTDATAGTSRLTNFSFNDSKNYWSADTYTKLNGVTNASITPIAFLEGGSQNYDITFHLDDGDVNYTGTIGIEDKLSQTIVNQKIISVLSLFDKKIPETVTDKNGNTCKFIGFTTTQNDKSTLIDENFPAIGTIGLYPYYEIDKEHTNLNATTETLTNGHDSSNVYYMTNSSNKQATVGDGGIWENNSGFSSGTTVIIPSQVKDNNMLYTVSEIGANAFASCVNLEEVMIPNTVTKIGENAFYQGTKIYVYSNSLIADSLKEAGYTVVKMPIVSDSNINGDINGDGVFDVSDVIVLKKWLLANSDTTLANWQAGDFNQDNMLNIFDWCLMKNALLNH